MANKYKFETRDERIERMFRDNPGRPIELCTAVVDGLWDKGREAIADKIPDRYTEATIDDLGYSGEELMEAVELLFMPPKQGNDVVGLVLSGPAGTGKTHAMYALVKWLSERNPEMISGIFTYSAVMQALRQEFAKDGYDELGSMWDRLNNVSNMYDGVLFIDDVSMSKQTDFEIDKLTMVLDRRMNNYMPFVLTTNISPEDFKMVFGERLASRLLGYTKIVQFTDVDKRIVVPPQA